MATEKGFYAKQSGGERLRELEREHRADFQFLGREPEMSESVKVEEEGGCEDEC